MRLFPRHKRHSGVKTRKSLKHGCPLLKAADENTETADIHRMQCEIKFFEHCQGKGRYDQESGPRNNR